MSKILIIDKNKRARFDYALGETYEAGLELRGTEVKALRAGKGRCQDAFVKITDKFEAFIHNLFIGHYDFGNQFNHEETRARKLLLHKKEIRHLQAEMQKTKATLIPTILYFKEGRVKCEIALAKGKKLHDKRQDQAARDVERKLRAGRYDE